MLPSCTPHLASLRPAHLQDKKTWLVSTTFLLKGRQLMVQCLHAQYGMTKLNA